MMLSSACQLSLTCQITALLTRHLSINRHSPINHTFTCVHIKAGSCWLLHSPVNHLTTHLSITHSPVNHHHSTVNHHLPVNHHSPVNHLTHLSITITPRSVYWGRWARSCSGLWSLYTHYPPAKHTHSPATHSPVNQSSLTCQSPHTPVN